MRLGWVDCAHVDAAGGAYRAGTCYDAQSISGPKADEAAASLRVGRTTGLISLDTVQEDRRVSLIWQLIGSKCNFGWQTVEQLK